eukprot:TRINITY_DN179_c1_g1_i1.p1 TRINITY_DN179_c1_g1~~TRINITY_DN179_c1_g1_i1.p1  ORF type:complete len:533 (-),score=66.82 TRINITY_DN179_c1_g1_i1:400-1797(-)
MGGKVFISVNDPELSRKLLMKSHHRPLNELTPPSGGLRRLYQLEGLFWSKGQKFKSLKSAWQVAFNQGSVHNYFPLMQRHVNQLCDIINQKVKNNEVFNIHENVQKMTLEVVGSTAFGIELGLLSENKGDPYGIQPNELLSHLRVIFQGTSSGSGGRTPWAIMNFLFPEALFLWGELSHRVPLVEREKFVVRAIEGIVGVSRTIVKHEQIKMNTEQNSNLGLNGEDEKGSQRNIINPGSFIAKIAKTKDVNSGQMLANDQVGAQAYLFLLAGYDTTANALAFSTYLLCQNPLKKQKLFEELDQFSDDDSSLTYQTLDKCIYLEAVIKEALRIYPPGAGAARQTTDKIQLSKYTLPPKSNFFVNIYGMHRDPTIWSKPEEFIPERFLEGDAEYVLDKIHPFAYMPFGGGSRMCIGHRFAMQEAKLALFRMFKKFDFELQPGQEKLETKVAITLSPKNGVFVKAYKR